jgi:hypothetical protein
MNEMLTQINYTVEGIVSECVCEWQQVHVAAAGK